MKLIDFDLIDSKAVRLSLGTVDVRSGNSVYFDNGKSQDWARARDGERCAAAWLPAVQVDGE